MPHESKILEELGIIKIIYIGDVTLEERVTLITELTIDHMKSSDKLKILLDARSLVTSMTMIEQEVWGKFISSNKKLKKASVAVIYREGNDLNQQAIEHVKQAGHIFEQFHDEELAMKWLNEQ